MLDFGEDLFEKENVLKVIKDLSVPCYDCRLGHFLQPKFNRGLVVRGNPQARIALVSIMPGPKEMETGLPLSGPSGQLGDTWFKACCSLDTNKDMYVINVVQCKPPDVDTGELDKNGNKKYAQREPEPDEFSTCFPNRCLRILKAMPNLEMIVVLGWSAAKMILGGEPKEASHMGHFYTTNLLPGVVVYCLPHPAALIREENKSDKVSDAYLTLKYKIEKCLKRFKRQYLDLGRVVDLAKESHNTPKEG